MHEIHGPGAFGTTKPDDKAGEFCGDRRTECHVFHTSWQAVIKTYHSMPTRQIYGKMVQNLTQIKSTMTAIEDSDQ